MLEEILLYTIIFLYGIVIGSFLNVLIYRIPKKENIAVERSHCMSCGARIKWYDLIPVFSYLILKGKCRNCNAHISIQYPIVEAVNGLLYVFIFRYQGFTPESILYCLISSVFIVISVIDFRTYEIPFCLNIAIFVLAVIRLIVQPGQILSHLAGMTAVSGFMFLCLVIGRKLKGVDAFGGGDIKLMAAAGLFLGVKQIILGFLLGCIFGSVIHTIRMKISDEDHVLAFGPYLCMGMFAAMLFGNIMINWYLGKVGY